MLLVYVGVALLAYLIGAIPMGGVVAGVRRIDLRRYGSGKLGTTNVLRTIGKRAAALVLAGDFLKGSLAVWLAQLVAGALAPGASVSWLDDRVSVITLASAIAAAAAICGHVWSIYMRLFTGEWSGGRGVATALGCMVPINPLITLTALAFGIPTIIVSRYVSLGSIIGALTSALLIVLMVILGQMNALSLLFIGIALFIILSHHDNIDRLLKGTERKIGERAKV